MANSMTLEKCLESQPVKVDKWNAQEVKVALDDLVIRYFVEEANYVEDKKLLYQKVWFALALTILGGITGLYARFTPFSEAKVLTIIGAGCYMILLGYYTFWLSFLIIPTCFRGTLKKNKTTTTTTDGNNNKEREKGGEKALWLQSRLDLPSAVYGLAVIEPLTGNMTKVSKEWNIGKLIQEDGVICGKAFCGAMHSFVQSGSFESLLKKD